MALLDRLQGILLRPRAEWPKIAAEPETVQGLYTGWIAILAAIGPVAILAGMGFGLRVALLSYVNSLVAVAVIALIVDVLAPNFGGRRDYVAALKLVAYSAAAGWVAQVAWVLPMLGMLAALAGAIYGFYLFLLGAPVLDKCAPERAVAFTIVVLLCAIVLLYLVEGVIFGQSLMTMGRMGPGFGA
jgi:hypothetical protein